MWLYPAPGQGRTPSQGPWAPGRAWGGAGLCCLALLVPVLGPHLLAYIRCWSLRFCVGCLVCLPPGSRPLLWLCGAVSLPLSRGRTWAAPGNSRRFCCQPSCCPILAPAFRLSSWLCACPGVPVAQGPTGIIVPKPEMCWDQDPSMHPKNSWDPLGCTEKHTGSQVIPDDFYYQKSVLFGAQWVT